jgi:hypothetical protein
MRSGKRSRFQMSYIKMYPEWKSCVYQRVFHPSQWPWRSLEKTVKIGVHNYDFQRNKPKAQTFRFTSQWGSFPYSDLIRAAEKWLRSYPD